MHTSGQPSLFNLDYFVDRHTREGRAGKPALRCTYGDLAADINRAGNGLLQLGLQEEQRVLLVLPDCPEFIVAYFAVMKVGGTAVPTTTFGRTADYDYFLRESKARILIVHATAFSEIAPALNQQHHLHHVIVVGEGQTGHISWDEWLTGNSPEPSPLRRMPRMSRFGCGRRAAPVGRKLLYTCITAAGTTQLKYWELLPTTQHFLHPSCSTPTD
jgi:benzoate-CoA ligase